MADVARARQRALGVAAVATACALAGSIAATSSTACSVHNCDFSSVDLKDPAGQPTFGRMIGDDTWESTGTNEKWLDYPGQRLYIFHLPPELRGREMLEMLAYVSVDEEPNNAGEPAPNWAIASGNLGEFLTRSCTCFLQAGGNFTYPYDCDDYFGVKNDTCGQYFLRVVVRFAKDATNLCKVNDPAHTPVSSGDASSDGAPSDASHVEASSDAATDASPLDGAPDAPQDGASD